MNQAPYYKADYERHNHAGRDQRTVLNTGFNQLPSVQIKPYQHNSDLQRALTEQMRRS